VFFEENVCNFITEPVIVVKLVQRVSLQEEIVDSFKKAIDKLKVGCKFCLNAVRSMSEFLCRLELASNRDDR